MVLDPGHGGRDPGTLANGVREADVNLAVCRAAEEWLLDQNFRVLMTRASDVYVARRDRARLANRELAECFVSVHVNASIWSRGKAHGTQCYVFSKGGKTERLARLCTKLMFDQLGSAPWGGDDGVFLSKTLGVLLLTKPPAVLIEIGFATNADESRNLVDPAWQKRCGEALGEAVVRWFRPEVAG